MSSQKWRLHFSILLVSIAAGLAIASLWRSPAVPSGSRRTPAILVHEEDGLRFEYQVATGFCALYDVAKDPHGLVNLAAARPDDAARFRRELESELGLESLRELHVEDEDTIRRLHALGYL